MAGGTKWHGGVLDFIIMLNGTCVLSQVLVDGGQQSGVLLGIPFKISRGISIPKLSWVWCKGGSILRGAVLELTAFNSI